MSLRRDLTNSGESGWSINPLQVVEIPMVMEIERQGYANPWSEGVFRDCFRPEYQLWALRQHTRLIGYAIVAALFDEAHLLNLCIEPSSRSSGAGRHLLRHLTCKAFESGMSRVLLEVRVSNERAIGLYKSEGFTQIGLRPEYYPGAGAREDALVLALEAIPRE